MMKSKQIWMIALTLLLVFCLTACGEKAQEKPAEDIPAVPEAETAEEPAAETEAAAPEDSGETVSGIRLVPYTDLTMDYTMLSPDEDQENILGGKNAGCYVWIVMDEDGNESVMFGYSEYWDESILYPETTADISDPRDIPEAFSAKLEDTILSKAGLNITPFSSGTASYEDTTVSGLPAITFTEILEGGDEDHNYRDYGMTGFCVLGECRPYVFWALDMSEDISNMDMAMEVLEACTADFAEGN